MQSIVTRYATQLLVAVLLSGSAAIAQTPESARPNLGPVVPPLSYQHALQKGTRLPNGAPGPRYWINSAAYRINARIVPETKRLEGSVEITYRNNSPDTLHNLHLDVTQNYQRGDAIRYEPISENTDGMELKRVAVNGTVLASGATAGPRYQVFDTRLVILPPAPVLPGQTVNIAIDYAFTIPQAGIGERMGWSKDNLFFIGYWYPQMAVYDDVVGWHPDPFTGTTEFYADFANYDYTVEMPAGWVLLGTGELANAQQVLSPDVYQRLQRAENSDQVVNIITKGSGRWWRSIRRRHHRRCRRQAAMALRRQQRARRRVQRITPVVLGCAAHTGRRSQRRRQDRLHACRCDLARDCAGLEEQRALLRARHRVSFAQHRTALPVLAHDRGRR